jgi:TolB protein
MPILLFVALFLAQKTAIQNEAPSVAPDGSLIAYVSERDGVTDLYVIKPDGSGERRLTHSPELERSVEWSPDSRQLRFTVFTKEKADSLIYAIDRDGGNLREIGHVPGRVQGVSPDGKHILYATGGWNTVRLIVSDLDGTNARQLTDGTYVVWNSRWSPDGKQIAYTGRDASDMLHVYVMNSDGSNLRQFTHLGAGDGRAQVPMWSRDGRQIAFQANHLEDHSAHIWIEDVATGNAKKLAAHEKPYLDELPCWFPDGGRIAFQSNRTGEMQIWIMNVNGTEARQITGDRAN